MEDTILVTKAGIETMKPSLNCLSASKLAEMIRAGEITSRQTVEAYLAQIEKQNPTYNAIVTLNEGQALAQADQADQAMRDDKPCGPLHGVPITIPATHWLLRGESAAAGRTANGVRPVGLSRAVRDQAVIGDQGAINAAARPSSSRDPRSRSRLPGCSGHLVAR